MLRWRVHEIAAARGLDRHDVKRLTGLYSRTIDDIFDNTATGVTWPTVWRVTEGLGVPWNELFYDDGHEPPTWMERRGARRAPDAHRRPDRPAAQHRGNHRKRAGEAG